MGNIFVIFGPSGSGQDSVIEGLKKILPIELATTTTTRKRRPGESEGHPYYFISPEKFQEGIKRGDFIEYAKTYNDALYGLTKKEFERIERSGKVGIWKTDFQGARTARKLFPDLPIIFISAPLEILEKRLRQRDMPDEAYLQKRLNYIKEWLPHIVYDYQVENEEGKLEETIQKVADIIRQEKRA